MAGRAILTPRCNSHPFQERTVLLDQQIKIGRSVARAKPGANNAIFDCKVLSRNHALLWYDKGKFYLQDTKSSNGTFVNNKCLGKGAEESPPREVCSGDIVQFGVDVMENGGKVTHGCIIATLKLFFPDGKEAKASPSTSIVQGEAVSLEDIYVLHNYLQDALHRESQLEAKLSTLQRLLEDLHKNSELGWKALMTEDRLLTHIDSLEAQLQKYSKNAGEDNLKEELKKLQEDKNNYQETAKASVQRILEDKLEAVTKYENLEQAVKIAETRNVSLKHMLDRCQVDLQELARKFGQQVTKTEELGVKLRTMESSHRETCEQIEQEKKELKDRLEEQMEVAKNLQSNFNTVEGYLEVALQQLLGVQSHLANMYAAGQTELPIESIRERINDAIGVAMNKISDCEKLSPGDKLRCEIIERAESKAEFDVSKKEMEIDGERDMPKNLKEDDEFKPEKEVQIGIDEVSSEKLNDLPEEPESFWKLQWETQQSEKIVRNGVENISSVCNNVSLEADLQQLRTENSKLRQENHMLQQQFSVDLLEMQTLKSKNKRLSENIEELQSELITLRERYTDCNLERTRLSNSMRESVPGQEADQCHLTQNRLLLPGLFVAVAFFLGLWLKF